MERLGYCEQGSQLNRYQMRRFITMGNEVNQKNAEEQLQDPKKERNQKLICKLDVAGRSRNQ